MELVTIYQDSECKIQTYRMVADWLASIANKNFRLSPMAAEQVLEETLYYLRTKQELKGRRVITTSKIPIFNRGHIFDLLEPYRDLEEAILLLSEGFDNTIGELTQQEKRDLSGLVHLYYKTQLNKDCYLYFFDEKINEVYGSIGYFTEDNIIILPFSLNEKDFYQTLY